MSCSLGLVSSSSPLLLRLLFNPGAYQETGQESATADEERGKSSEDRPGGLHHQPDLRAQVPSGILTFSYTYILKLYTGLVLVLSFSNHMKTKAKIFVLCNFSQCFVP